MLLLFLFVLLQTSNIAFTSVQIVTYILTIVNILCLIIMGGLVKPTYNKVIKHEEKYPKIIETITKVDVLHSDFINRTSPQAIELARLEKVKLDKFEKDISDIKHNLNNLSLQLTPLLKKLEDEPDLSEVLKAINELTKKL